MITSGYIEKIPDELLVEIILANLERLQLIKAKGMEFSMEHKACSEFLSKLEIEAQVRGLSLVKLRS